MATRNNRASRYAAPIGGVFIVLCLIGFVSLIGSCFRFTQGLLDNSTAKHDYEQMLLPVVMFDPPPYEDPKTMRQVDLLMYSIWAAALSDKRDVYEYDDSMAMVIPASDVDMAAYQLFGPEVTLSHNTFGDYEITYLYDATTKSYHVPVTAITGFYTPQVEEIVKKNDIVQLKVGYVPPATALNIDLSGKGYDERTPDKFMIYELRKGKKELYLYAIRDVEGASYMTGGSEANPLVNDLFDEFNDPDFVAEEPADQLEFLPQGGSSASSDGESASESGESGSGESQSDPDTDEEGGESGSDGSSASVSAPDIEG